MSMNIGIPILALALFLPVAGRAQDPGRVADMKHCTALSEQYARYVGTGDFAVRTGNSPDATSGVGRAKCAERDAATGIRILERLLTDAKVEPARRSQAEAR